MKHRPILTTWLVAMIIGSTVAVYGVFTNGLLTPWGLAVNTIACIIGLLRMRPRETAFVAESLVIGLFTVLILANVIRGPFLLITLFFIWLIVQLPLMVLATALSEHFKAALQYRVALHIALTIAPISILAFSFLQGTRYPLDDHPLDITGDSLAEKTPPFIDSPEYWKSIPYASAGTTATPDEAQSLEINKSAAVVAMDLAEIEDIAARCKSRLAPSFT